MTSDKRELAIKYLTEEIRSLRMAPQINGCGPENWAEQLEIMETCLEAVRSAHFADAGKMQPLTLEQLREMVDKPAYLYIYETALSSGWHIIKAVTKDKIIFRGWDTVYVPISSLGKCFDLYAYTPAHIDREAWVSVEDRLPEDNKDGETVLVIVSGKPHENITLHRAIMTAGYFQGEGWVVNEYPEWESPEVTYWMPLPEPPESRPPDGQS